MRVFYLFAEDVDLGVDGLRGMDADLDLARGDVAHEADHALLHGPVVGRFLNVPLEFGEKLRAGSDRIGAELQTLVPSLLNQPIDVDADKDSDFP